MLIKFEKSCDPHFLPQNVAEMLSKSISAFDHSTQGMKLCKYLGEEFEGDRHYEIAVAAPSPAIVLKTIILELRSTATVFI